MDRPDRGEPNNAYNDGPRRAACMSGQDMLSGLDSDCQGSETGVRLGDARYERAVCLNLLTPGFRAGRKANHLKIVPWPCLTRVKAR